MPERAADSADDAMEEEKDRRMDAADLPEANAATDLGLVDKITASIMRSLIMFTTHESFKAPTLRSYVAALLKPSSLVPSSLLPVC